MKMCSTSIVTKEMQIKTTLQYHYTAIRMAKMKTMENTISKDMEQSETCWWECKLVNYLAISINIEICTPLTKYSVF